MNQLADENHRSMTIEHEVQNNIQVGKGLGYPQFISHSELSHNPVKNTQYLKNNTLYFHRLPLHNVVNEIVAGVIRQEFSVVHIAIENKV